MEALWVHQWHNVVDEDLLKRMLYSPDYHARAAATRVLCYWRDRVKDPLSLLEGQVKDASPRVRLEAVRACSFFTNSRAAEIKYVLTFVKVLLGGVYISLLQINVAQVKVTYSKAVP